MGVADGPAIPITVPTDSALRAPSPGIVGPEVQFPLWSAREHSGVVPVPMLGVMRVSIQ